MHLSKYLNQVKSTYSPVIAEAIRETINSISPKHIQKFDFNSHRTGLLLGNVQSGKTLHMLGVMAEAADHDFEVFVVLTTDSTHLQQQTVERAKRLLGALCVCDEQEDAQFFLNDLRKPVVLVLKKNIRILETWKNNLISSGFLVGRPVFIIDDEGDAASLNTKINKNNDVSSINQKITDIRALSNSSFYLQVTATPQSLFLQEEISGYKPDFVYYFKPGNGYIGGNFFYKTADPYAEDQIPFPIRFTDEEELNEMRDNESHIPEGMLRAIATFLITTAEIHLKKLSASCNFLVHPSVSISDHEVIAERIGEVLNALLDGIRNDESFVELLQDSWVDLYSTKPDMTDFKKCHDFVSDVLENEKVTISVMNSKASATVNFDEGINIIVGGNSLGRGVTFPNLQTTYYCRKSKKPQADTFWQHCRAFGYDRSPSLVRMFIPPSLFKLFSELNNANNAMIEFIERHRIDELRLIYPKGINPTRLTVINKKKVEVLTGGVNYFPSFPTEKNADQIDNMLETFSEENEFYLVDIALIKSLICLCEAEFKNDWPSDTYIGCIDSLEERDQRKGLLIVRRNRNIGQGTGTLLSPNDRKLGDQHPNNTVLTMYQVTGQKWGGRPPFWIPNIKLPTNKLFYNMNE